NTANMNANEKRGRMWTKLTTSILTLTQVTMIERLTVRKSSLHISIASRKYCDRSPHIANKLEGPTMNGTSVTAKIAVTESTANIRSLDSTMANTTNSGVAIRRPPRRTKKLCHS